MYSINDVVQFNDSHKWCGSLGIIIEKKQVRNAETSEKEYRYMIGVPYPIQGMAYIFVMESECAIEYIGKAIFVPNDKESEEE